MVTPETYSNISKAWVPISPTQQLSPDFSGLKTDYSVNNRISLLFTGGFGHTYGCHAIWQMLAPGREPIVLVPFLRLSFRSRR